MNKNLIYRVLAATLLAEASGLASAQATPPAAPAAPAAAIPEARTGIEEVIVTARKREESAQSIPVAVSAISGKDLQAAGVVTVEDLSSKVPSLSIGSAPSQGKSSPSFMIRGQRQSSGGIYVDQSVGLYMGDIPIARPLGMNQSLYDMQSVEVLKGPQGTLFGRNTTGGAILFKPNRPTDEFEGYVSGTVGNLGTFNEEVMVNQPLGDRAAIRVAGSAMRSDGYVTDVINGDKLGGDDSKSYRVSLSLNPMDKLDSLFVYSRYMENSQGTPYKLNKINNSPTSLFNLPASAIGVPVPGATVADLFGYNGANSLPNLLAAQQARGYYETASGVEAFTKVVTWDIANTTSYELSDALTLKNIVGYRNVTSNSSDDLDGSPLAILHVQEVNDMHQFSEEFQLLGKANNLDWVAGAFYFSEEGRMDWPSIQIAPTPTSIFALFGLPTLAPGTAPDPFDWPAYSDNAFSAKNTSASVFAQGTFHLDSLLEGLSTTIGARYTSDKRESTGLGHTPTACRIVDASGVPLPLDQCSISADKSFTEPTGTFSLEYKVVPKTLVYAAVRRGYRSGGINGSATSQAIIDVPFKPEIITDVEFGAKSDWHLGDMPVRTNLAVFSSDYKDIQRLDSKKIGNTIVSSLANAASATIQGGELEVTLLPTDNLQLTGFASVISAKYDKYDALNSQGQPVDKSDAPFGQVPAHSYSGTARYSLPIDFAMGEVSVQVNYTWTDDYAWQDALNEDGTPSYGLWNLGADWQRVMGSDFDVSLFMRNALGKEYSAAGFSLLPDLSYSGAIPSEPRTYGAQLRYRF